MNAFNWPCFLNSEDNGKSVYEASCNVSGIFSKFPHWDTKSGSEIKDNEIWLISDSEKINPLLIRFDLNLFDSP